MSRAVATGAGRSAASIFSAAESAADVASLATTRAGPAARDAATASHLNGSVETGTDQRTDDHALPDVAHRSSFLVLSVRKESYPVAGWATPGETSGHATRLRGHKRRARTTLISAA